MKRFVAILAAILTIGLVAAPEALAQTWPGGYTTSYVNYSTDDKFPTPGHSNNGTDFQEADCYPPGIYGVSSQIEVTTHSSAQGQTYEVGFLGGWWFTSSSATGPQRARIWSRTIGGVWTLKADSGSTDANFPNNTKPSVWDTITVSAPTTDHEVKVALWYESADPSKPHYDCETPTLTVHAP